MALSSFDDNVGSSVLVKAVQYAAKFKAHDRNTRVHASA
jgi:hypothetical protein